MKLPVVPGKQAITINDVDIEDDEAMERVEETKQPASRDGRRNTVKRRHTLDPDKPSGARELLVLNVASKDCIIEATVRENTDLASLYERIHLIGDFDQFPKKFRKIFLAFSASLLEEANEILKRKQRDEHQRSETDSSQHSLSAPEALSNSAIRPP